MLGQRSTRWQTCGSTSRVAGGAQQRLVVTKAFKRNKGGNRPGFATPDLPPQQYNLPPLDGQQYAPAPPQQQQAGPPQQQQPLQRPQTGGAPQPPPQQQQQQGMPLPPQQPGWGQAPAQPAVQSPPAQPGFNQQPGFNNQPAVQSPPAQPGFNNNQPGFVNSPPAQPGFNQQQAGFVNNGAAQPGFVNSPPPQPGFNNNQQPGFNNQQPGFVNGPPAPAAPQQTQGQNPPMYQNPAQGYQQQAGFVQPVQAPPQQYPPQGQPQQGGYNAGGGWQQQQPQQQQPGFQQQGWSELGGYLDDMGGYIDSNGRVNPNDAGGYISTPQRSGWQQQGGNSQGYYKNARQQQQQQQRNQYTDGGYLNDQGGWNQNQQRNNRPGFSGFADDNQWADDFLLRQLDMNLNNQRLMDDWVEETEVVEDLTPKYVNGKRVLVNSEIEAPKVRVQDSMKGDLGIMSFEQARETAYSQDVDVVMITEDADPPVVRLVAFSKYKYELEKSAKQKQKASKGPEIKEVKLRPVTEKADYDTKVKQAQKFLLKGAKVKLTMTFSGREMRFKDQGKEMMLKLIEELSSTSKMEAPLALRPSNFSVTLVPLK